MAFKVGDVVALKSNRGVAMTVDTVNGEDITVVWLDKTNKKQIDVFKAAMLEPYSSLPPPSRG